VVCIDVSSRLFIYPDKITDSPRVSASIFQCFEHINFASAGIAVFARVCIEGKELYAVEINAFFRQKIEGEDARLG
jgi:hypothetical protein